MTFASFWLLPAALLFGAVTLGAAAGVAFAIGLAAGLSLAGSV